MARILMWTPTSHLESARLEGLICIFVQVSKVFNESWQRPVWQIRWAPRWERRRELLRRRTLRLKPEAQSRADQHLRQPGAKPCKSLSPFLFPFSASSLSPAHHIPLKHRGKSTVQPLALSLSLPCFVLTFWSQLTVAAKYRHMSTILTPEPNK